MLSFVFTVVDLSFAWLCSLLNGHNVCSPSYTEMQTLKTASGPDLAKAVIKRTRDYLQLPDVNIVTISRRFVSLITKAKIIKINPPMS